jgi:hypothetical protein
MAADLMSLQEVTGLGFGVVEFVLVLAEYEKASDETDDSEECGSDDVGHDQIV